MLKCTAWDLMGLEPPPGSDEHLQYQARAESLMKVLAEFGVRPSGSLEKLFSNPNSPAKASVGDDLMDVSPDVVEPSRGSGAAQLPPVGPLPVPPTTEAGAAVAPSRAPDSPQTPLMSSLQQFGPPTTYEQMEARLVSGLPGAAGGETGASGTAFENFLSKQTEALGAILEEVKSGKDARDKKTSLGSIIK